MSTLIRAVVVDEKMIKAFNEVWKIHKNKKVDLRTAAYILALQRLAGKVSIDVTRSLRNP